MFGFQREKKMDFANYKMEWPREGLTVRCFAHDIMNYRYHWHPDEYELNILLHGSQEYCRGTQNVLLEEDDVLLTPPGVGHASFGQQANTTAIVLHFSAAAIRPFFKKSGVYHFPTCLSDEGTRTEERYRQIRFYASQIFTLMQQNSLYAQLAVRASLELLLVVLCTEFEPQRLNEMPEDERRRSAIRRLLTYVEEHYAEKLTLENLADFAQYNRTYVSTLFKQVVGGEFPRIPEPCALPARPERLGIDKGRTDRYCPAQWLCRPENVQCPVPRDPSPHPHGVSCPALPGSCDTGWRT